MDTMDELIKTIALKHAVAVGRDDPILILHTLNEALQKSNAQAQQLMLDRFKEEMEAMARRWTDDSKLRAERVLNAALAASSQSMEASTRETAGRVRREVEDALRQLDAPITQARRMAALNIGVGVLSLVAACAAVWVLAFKL